MSRRSNNNHPHFTAYMNFIINHPNYRGLPIRYKDNGEPVWVAPKKSGNPTGNLREEWADKKAIEFGFEHSSKKYADTMLAIHPTQKKVCQWCGETMYLKYLYPTKNTINYFTKHFNYEHDTYDSIYEIVSKLPEHEAAIKVYLIEKANLDCQHREMSIDEVINQVEFACRMHGKSIFSPGAMSNFPDRFDGFHSYNLCCRKEKDKGRHDMNMATYNSDRRAYEYWSDGNIAAANQVMADKKLFNGLSADHIGPISLGFLHDPLFLQPMVGSDNSAKRDRLFDEDLKKLIHIEQKTGTSPASSFAREIWAFIKEDYLREERLFDLEWYKDLLKQNMVNFMESLWLLLNTNNRVELEKFLKFYYFTPKYETFFSYRYKFDANGQITQKIPRNITSSSKNEFNRLIRISLESVDNFHLKSIGNRHIQATLNQDLHNDLNKIQQLIIDKHVPYTVIQQSWERYIIDMQNELIADWTDR